jgi:hypothetical protein
LRLRRSNLRHTSTQTRQRIRGGIRVIDRDRSLCTLRRRSSSALSRFSRPFIFIPRKANSSANVCSSQHAKRPRRATIGLAFALERSQVKIVLDFFFEDRQLNVYAGEREVRPPRAPTIGRAHRRATASCTASSTSSSIAIRCTPRPFGGCCRIVASRRWSCLRGVHT